LETAERQGSAANAGSVASTPQSARPNGQPTKTGISFVSSNITALPNGPKFRQSSRTGLMFNVGIATIFWRSALTLYQSLRTSRRIPHQTHLQSRLLLPEATITLVLAFNSCSARPHRPHSSFSPLRTHQCSLWGRGPAI
jgi:hypothetical protein